jgi:hypothetical protein
VDRKPEPNPDKDTSQAPAPDRATRAEGRASMRPEFLALFRDTRPASGTGEVAPPDVSTDETRVQREAHPALVPPQPSRFLRRFLQQTAPLPTPASSGLLGLDSRLGGGFGYGLHLVLGPPGSGKTAFLESLAWEAVATERPALYYALKTGSLQVWEHLIGTLSTILDGAVITPAALKGQDLVPNDVETLTRLDAVLQGSVLPYLSLVDATPASSGSITGFIEDVRARVQEAGDQRGRLPLVLVDDLERLMTLTGSRSPMHVLSRLDDALVADSIPGLLAGSPDGLLPEGLLTDRPERLPGQTVLTLAPAFPSSAAGPGRVDVEIRKNQATGWTGSVTLLLDPWSGLFAELGSGT